MGELSDFGAIVAVVAGAFALAVLSHKLTEWVPVPAPGIFLLAAAGAEALFPRLGEQLSIRGVERLAVVALIVVLFDGGMRIGWRRLRVSLVPIVSLGVLGTFATAALMAVAAKLVLGFGWTTAGLLGAALAPTDPAVMFSVLGKRQIGGRMGTILEGESGANDPVGIALMIGMLEFAKHSDATVWTVVREFSVEMAVGLGGGVAGAVTLIPLLRRVSLPPPPLYSPPPP